MQRKKDTGNEKYKRKIKRRRIAVLSVFVAVLILCVCLFTPLFAITEINVTGNAYLVADDVIKTSGIEKGENVFRISERKAVKALSALPYVEGANIRRRFPAKIEIAIDEAKQDIIIDTENEFVVITMNGRVLEKTEDVSELTAPIVYGLDVKEAEPAKTIKPENEDKYNRNIGYLKSFYETDFWKDIDEFYTDDESNFMVTMKSGMKITFGIIETLESMQRKIKMVEKILPQVEQTKMSYLDLTTDKGYFGEYTQEELEEIKRRAESGESIIESIKKENEDKENAENSENNEENKEE